MQHPSLQSQATGFVDFVLSHLIMTTVIGVYLPCADLGTETYCEHLIELERIISDHQRLGPVVIMGDFNAH